MSGPIIVTKEELESAPDQVAFLEGKGVPKFDKHLITMEMKKIGEKIFYSYTWQTKEDFNHA